MRPEASIMSGMVVVRAVVDVGGTEVRLRGPSGCRRRGGGQRAKLVCSRSAVPALGAVTQSAAPPAAKGFAVTSEASPVLTEVILSSPEIVLVHYVLTTALDQSGLSMHDNPTAASIVEPLGVVHARWTQHVRDLDSGACGLSVDGIGLRVLTVPLSDIAVLVLALKGYLVGLSAQNGDEDEPGIDELQVQAVAETIARLKGLL